MRRSKADAANQRQAGVHDVVEALLGVLDEIELARQHGDLTGPFAAIAEKLESTLAQRFDVVRYGAEGEEFDPDDPRRPHAPGGPGGHGDDRHARSSSPATVPGRRSCARRASGVTGPE